MIKIIKPGVDRVATCPKCYCEFSYQEEDILRGDQRDPYTEVVCPWCNKHIAVDVNVSKIRN